MGTAGFDEEQHPRDDKGKFTEGGGGSKEGAGGLKAFADKHGAEGGASPSKVIAEAKTGKRKWTDKLPKGMTPETWQKHYSAHPDKGGQPSGERFRQVHKAIIRDALKVKPPAPGEQKIAIVTMGAPASGKSSAVKSLDQSKFVKVDADAVKTQLPEYKAATRMGRTYRGAAQMAHEESSAISKVIQAKAIERGNHLICDATGADQKSMIKKIEMLKANGYHVHLAFSHLDAENGMQRLHARAEHTGRLVPPKWAREMYDVIPKNFEACADHAHSWAVHDSSKKGAPVMWSKKDTGEVTEHDAAGVAAFKSAHGRDRKGAAA